MGNLVAYDENGNEVAMFGENSVTFTPDLDDKVSVGEPLKIKRPEGITLLTKMNSTNFYALMWLIEKRTIKDLLTPKHIVHNRKTAETIVIWKDGTKTSVKPMKGTPEEEMSYYSAFTAALAKKIYGSNTQVNKIVSGTTEPIKRKERLNEIIESMGDEG